MKKTICCIYKITSPSGSIYIGQTYDLKNRIKKYKLYKCKDQPRLYFSLKKYGWESHILSVVKYCNKEQLNDLEKFYIKKYKTFNTEHGLNLREGGNCGGKLSLESILKIKNKLLGKQNGEKNNFFGKKHTKESLLKMTGRKCDESAKEKMRQAWIDRKKNGWQHPSLLDCNFEKRNIQISKLLQTSYNKKIKSFGYLGVRGAYWSKKYVFDNWVFTKWESRININKKTIHLGTFNTKEEAALAYNKAAIKKYGKYAVLNVIS